MSREIIEAWLEDRNGSTVVDEYRRSSHNYGINEKSSDGEIVEAFDRFLEEYSKSDPPRNFSSVRFGESHYIF